MPIMPAPKARAAARPERLKEDNLNDEEKAMIAGLTAIRRNQMLKAIQHNRTAVGAGRHFIVWSGSNIDDVGQRTCRDCEMKGRWTEFKFFSKAAHCKRAHAGETMVRIKMREKAAQHNLGAVQAGHHVVDLAAGEDRFVCTACGKVQPRTVKHYLFLAARCGDQ